MSCAVARIANGLVDAEKTIVDAFAHEIGLHPGSPAVAGATFGGVAAALREELLLPLRALNEGQASMYRTHTGEPVPPQLINETVVQLIAAVLSGPGGFAEWRYSNPVGKEQLRGLRPEQVRAWRKPDSHEHEGGLRTHEGDASELGLFWATKIGGPSHGFDHEGQCLLPLLANARHKVLSVQDPAWTMYAAGRAHWRLLWSAPEDKFIQASPEARLWLEPVNCDFDAAGVVDPQSWTSAVLYHAIRKADDMQVPLSVAPELEGALSDAVEHWGSWGGRVMQVRERLELRPSNGVLEASDLLSQRHDWVQLEAELTEPLERTMYIPRQSWWQPEHWLRDAANRAQELTYDVFISSV